MLSLKNIIKNSFIFLMFLSQNCFFFVWSWGVLPCWLNMDLCSRDVIQFTGNSSEEHKIDLNWAELWCSLWNFLTVCELGIQLSWKIPFENIVNIQMTDVLIRCRDTTSNPNSFSAPYERRSSKKIGVLMMVVESTVLQISPKSSIGIQLGWDLVRGKAIWFTSFSSW